MKILADSKFIKKSDEWPVASDELGDKQVQFPVTRHPSPITCYLLFVIRKS